MESLASDLELPNYVFEGPGEILGIKEDYAQVRWRRPVPDVWFKLDQLKEYSAEENWYLKRNISLINIHF